VDEAVQVTLLTDQVNAITSIISNRDLHIFTTGAEFKIDESPVTPENITVKPQTNIGSKRIRPVVLEGATVYTQRTGKGVYAFQFSDSVQATESVNLAILAPHLISNPKQMVVQRGGVESTGDPTDAAYLYVVNDTGELAVLNFNASEGVQAFTRYKTAGDIVSATIVSDTLYVLVRRSTNAGFVHYLERELAGFNTDSNIFASLAGGTTVTGLDHLEGEVVKVKADGRVQPDKLVFGGSIELDRPANFAEVGLDFNAKIVTMPLNMNIQNGPNAGQKKRLMRCAVQLYESNGVIINGERLPDKQLAVDEFSGPIPVTGYERIFLHGWSLEATITVTQDEPMSMTILSLDAEVKT
jgi:hypothetical protein